MTSRRRTSWTKKALLGIAATAVGVAIFPGCGSTTETVKTAPIDATSPLATLAAGIGRSDEAALASIVNRLEPKAEGKPEAIPEAEAADWTAIVSALRGGFLRFEGANGRVATINAASRIVDRFGVEPAPATWQPILGPARDLFISALSDANPNVRAAALGAIGKCWHWYPGRTMLRVEEQTLGEWKDSFHPPVVKGLASPDPRTRVAAVVCLANLPIDALAAPAVAYIDDPKSGDVRHQVLVSFAPRRTLLTEDMILKRLHDPELGVPQLAEMVLKTRGLTPDQITLGRLISSPKAELRASVIPLMKDRQDLDPAVWLIRLSHDADELVRTKAIEAMTGMTSRDVAERLREMAAKDSSPAVRAVAGKLVASLGGSETTASLPPLPGSPSLTPRAN